MGTAVSTKKVKKGRASAQLAEGKEKKLVNLLEKTVEQNTIFEGRVIHVRVDQAELPNGKIASREVVEHPGGVTVAALTEKDELLFVRQFRYPFGKLLLELPAGKLERGEDPLEAGRRELLEETGMAAGRFEPIGKMYPTPGYCSEIIYLYAASELTYRGQKLDEDEFLEVERIPLREAVRQVLAGEISDAKTQIGILKTYLMRQGGEL